MFDLCYEWKRETRRAGLKFEVIWGGTFGYALHNYLFLWHRHLIYTWNIMIVQLGLPVDSLGAPGPSRWYRTSSFMVSTSIDASSDELSKLPQALNVRESKSGKLITLRLNVNTLAIGILTTFWQCFKTRS
jgi:hypothetical protein